MKPRFLIGCSRSANCKTGAEATEKSKIDQLIPGAQIDAYQFEPCGYSANAIMTGDYYWNIHVTPEKDFSYASFETNYPKENYEELLKQVIEIFKPGAWLLLKADGSTGV